jgi:predicted NBD/HSP70 family sugar kinase
MAADLRQTNRRRVLEVLLARIDEGVTQPDIEEQTRLSRTSVSAILRDLKPVLRPENGSIPLAESRGGRPARLFHLRDNIGAIGIDFGRSHVCVGVQKLTGSEPQAEDVVSREGLEIDVASEPDPALDLAAKLIDSLLGRPDAPNLIAGICIGLAAPVDCNGRVRRGPFQSWADLDLRAELFERLKHDVRGAGQTPEVIVNNDANLALEAELRWGAAKGVKNAIYLKWATGIGSASCVEGEVIRGYGGVAGEAGHTAVWGPGPDKTCRWCDRRCLEAVASLEAMDVPLAELVAIAGDPSHPQRASVEARVNDAARLIGRTLAPAINTLNPRVMIVGGLCAELFPDSLEQLREAVEESVFPSIERDLRIRASSQGKRAGVVGALAAVFDQVVPEYLIKLVE